ncbi:MAG: GNAT family N-acetyltransferase [Eubacterium sp.]|nr:GNAT family N-acetyltransferase [Eubacterium sp.]
MAKSEYGLLKDFLYDAIFIPEGVEPPDRSIVDLPELAVYYEDFGSGEADICVVADLSADSGSDDSGSAESGNGDSGIVNGDSDSAPVHQVGAAWSRIMNDYGHVDDDTPSIAISVKAPYRERGIGTGLLDELCSRLRDKGFSRVSLAVQKANYAVRMYERAGFRTIGENTEEYIMVKDLNV